MRLRPNRQAADEVAASEGAIVGPARVDSRTKKLTKRLSDGDIAVIDHIDIDRVSAEALVACGPRAVLNAAASISGRYPNLGPQIIVEAGIALVDNLGPDLMALKDGARIVVEDGQVRSGKLTLQGQPQSVATITEAMDTAREGLSGQIEAFAENTMDYIVKERELLLDGVGVPKVATPIEGRAVLIVVRGYHYKEDLQMLRSWIRESHPVLIGVDGGSDAILEAGWTPDLIVGDMDSVSDRALTCGAEIVVHAYRDGRAPGQARVERLGASHVVFPATGTSEDVAMLLADDMGAELIVAIGTHVTLIEFLDKGRNGMASTFLTRLRVGSKLVDAKGVSQLYRHTIPGWQLALLVAAGLAALAVALAVTPVGQASMELLLARWDDIVSSLGGFFSGG